MADGSQLTQSGYPKQRTLWRFLRIFLASWVVIGGSIAAIVGTGAGVASAKTTGGTTVYAITNYKSASDRFTGTVLGGTTAFTKCLTGSPATCAHFRNKDSVWLTLTRLTKTTNVGKTYFFAVVAPGTKNTPNDGGTANLSYGPHYTTGGTWTQREFTLTATGWKPVGTTTKHHAFDLTKNKLLQAAPFSTTTNPGGEYQFAVCLVPSTPNPSSGAGAPGATTCVKSKNFKVTARATSTISTSITPPSPDASYWTDTATVKGTSKNGAPTGTVTFYLCKVSSAAGETGTCTPSTGNKVPGSNPVTLTTGANDTSTATSPHVTESTPGSYCFGAVYGGSSKYAPSSDNTTTTTSAASECFSVVVPRFTVQKTDSAGPTNPVVPGHTLTYTITVTNVGTGAGTTALSDTLPTNVTYNADTLTCTATDCTNLEVTGTTVEATVHLGAGAHATVIFTVTVSPTTATTVTNTAQITGPCTTTAACTSTVQNPVPSFTVQKTDSAGPGNSVVSGSTIGYTITVTNVGTGAGTTTVSDTLPPNVIYHATSPSLTCTAGDCTNLTISGGTLTGTVSLAAGAHATITFTVTVSPTTATTVTNTAHITGPCSEAACTSTVTNPVPNITVHKADTPASGTTVTPGATLTYTLTAHNAGTAAGTDTIHDAAPSNTVLVAGSATCLPLPSTGACSVVSGSTPLSWTVTVPAGTTVSVSFKVKVNATDTATVYNHGTYSGPGCVADSCTTNTVTNPITVVTPTVPPSPPPATPKFTVTKSDSPGSGKSVVPGATIAYSVLVDNVGTASGKATVTDPLPGNVTLSSTPTCATVASGDTCSVKVTGTTLVIKVTLARGDSAKATFDAVVKPTDTTTVVNTATITTGPCTSPHCSSTVTNPVVVLSVVKSSAPPSGSIVPRGTKVTYTLTLTDSGTAATTPITLTDKVPVGTTYVSGSATCGSAPTCNATEKTGTVTWAPIIVQPGAASSLSVSFQAVVGATDTTGEVITNVAVFTNDGTPSCTSSTCTTNKVTLKVTAPSSAATHAPPPTSPTLPPPAPPIPAATTPHTGEPWAGSRWLELMVLVAGLGLLASGETLRRRRRAKTAGQ